VYLTPPGPNLLMMGLFTAKNAGKMVSSDAQST
jgi:hypothetical protein